MIVTSNAALVGSGTTLVITTVGLVASNCISNKSDASFPLVAASIETFSKISKLTGPSIIGVISTVYSDPLTGVNALGFPFIIVMSAISKPVTSSLNKIVAVNATFEGSLAVEEISIVEKEQNLGWNVMEATHCFKPKTGCDTSNLILPKVEYGRSEGQSITGGYVYNGKVSTELKNQYIYGDFMSGNIWGVNYPSFTAPKKLMPKQGYLSTFALDADGEIYVAEYSKGIVYQIVP